MAQVNILLDIVARNLADSVFGDVFGNLAMMAMMTEQFGMAADGTLTPLGSMLAVLEGAGIAFGLFSSNLETAIDDAAQFEFQLARLQNATGATDAEFASMRQNIEDVAGASIFTTSEVAQAYTVMANNLIPVDTIVSGLGKDAIILSEAMGTDAVSGAQLLTQAFRDFSNQGWTGQQMIDMLTRAFHDGMPDVSGMASLLGTAGGNADAMGVSLQDLLAVADLLAPAMGSVSKAGTSINYMLTGITDPTSKAAGEFQKLGLIVGDNNKFYDAQGNFIGLANAIDLIKQSLDGMTNEEKANALDQLFNVRSGQGARILTDLTDFKGKYDQIFADLGQTGAAQEAANRLVDTWQGRLNELKTNIQSFFANIGQPIINDLKPALGDLADLVGNLGKNKALDDFLGKFLLVGTAISGLTLIALGLAAAIAFMAPVLALIGASFLAIAGFSAEVAGLWELVTNKGNPVHDVVQAIATALGHLKDIIGQAWTAAQPFVQSLKDIAQIAGDNLRQSFQQLGTALTQIKDSIPQSEWDTFLGVLKTVGAFIGGTLLVVLVGLAVGVIAAFSVAITFLAGLVSTIISLATLIIQTLATVGLVIQDLTHGKMDQARADWNTGWSHMAQDAQNFGTQVVNTVANTANSVQTSQSMFSAVGTSLGTSLGNGIFNGYQTSMNDNYQEFVRIAGNTADGIARPLRFQSPPKEGPLSDSDQWGGRFTDLLVGGMTRGLGTLKQTAGQMATAMSVTPGVQGAQASVATAFGQTGTITVPVYLDGRQIAETVFDVLKGQLKGMGMSRLYK